MFTKQAFSATVNVLLVGLGGVGAAAASPLGRYGVGTLVIEKSEEIFMSPRPIGYGQDRYLAGLL